MAAYDASFTFSRLLFDLEKPQNPQVLTVLVDVDECLCTNQDKWRLNYPQLTKTLMKEGKDLEGKKTDLNFHPTLAFSCCFVEARPRRESCGC